MKYRIVLPLLLGMFMTSLSSNALAVQEVYASLDEFGDVRHFLPTIAKKFNPSTVTLEPGKTAEIVTTTEVTFTGYVNDGYYLKLAVELSAENYDIPERTATGFSLYADDGTALDHAINCHSPTFFPLTVYPGSWHDCILETFLPGNLITHLTMIFDTENPANELVGEFSINYDDAQVEAGYYVDATVSVDDAQDLQTGYQVNEGDQLPSIHSYSVTAGPFTDAQCGQNEIDGPVMLIGDFSRIVASVNPVITVTVDCPTDPGITGCVQPWKYWLANSGVRGRPFNDIWKKLADGTRTKFFENRFSWYQALKIYWSRGYFGAAKEYIAAKLNSHANASMPDAVIEALSEVEGIFQERTFGSYIKLRWRDRDLYNSLKAELANNQQILRDYNRGNATGGPQSCM